MRNATDAASHPFRKLAATLADACGVLGVSLCLTGCPLSDNYFVETSRGVSGMVSAGGVGGTIVGGTGVAGAFGTGGAGERAAGGGVGQAAAPGTLLELARNKEVLASSEQLSRGGNVAPFGNDGSPTTRWSAAGPSVPEWWRVDLGVLHDIARIEIDWEFARPYGYLIEASTDDSSYIVIADRSGNTDPMQSQHADVVVSARYVRITVVAVTTMPISWPSFWEMRVWGR
jgi:F5/8 type C domain